MSSQASSTQTGVTGLFARGPRGYAGGMSVGLPPEDFDLPHPRISARLMLLVHEALVIAFSELRRLHGSLALEKEDSVTVPLYEILENDVRQRKRNQRPDAVAGFDDTLIESIVRHNGTTDHTGIQLKKEPDLFFKLRPPDSGRVLPSHYAIFVECKPVGKRHSVRSKYCDDGLIRFVKGEYAWAMQDALMIGFARHKRTIAGHLSPVLEEMTRRKTLGISPVGRALRRVPGGKRKPQSEELHVSKHRRAFKWQWKKGRACPIRVYHSWHECS